MNDAVDSHRALTIENRNLKRQLEQAQDLLVQTAIDAGHLHARIAELQDELRIVRAERDVLAASNTRLPVAPAPPSPNSSGEPPGTVASRVG